MDTKKLERVKEACQGALGKADHESGQYLPLWVHLVDTGEVLGLLFDRNLSRQQKSVFKRFHPDWSDACLRKLFVLTGYLHDLGKLSNAFQFRMEELVPDRFSFGIPVTGGINAAERKKVRHGNVGAAILKSMDFPLSYSSVIAAHHGISPDEIDEDLLDLPGTFKGVYGDRKNRCLYKKLWEGVAGSLLDLAGLSRQDLEGADLYLPEACILCGCLIEADWIASNTDFFPLLKEGEAVDCGSYHDRVETGWRRLDLPGSWKAPETALSEEFVASQFKFDKLNPLQLSAMRMADALNGAGLMIVEAQMGTGKTEAALAAAEVFAQKTGAGGVFFGLPTQATANGLLPRFEAWSGQTVKNRKENVTFRLAHSASVLNEYYRKLPRGQAFVDADDTDGVGRLIVNEWMQGSKRQLLSDFVVGTVDQALGSVLDQRHVLLQHVGLSGKVLILDEVHAYDAYTGRFLHRLLEWAGAYRIPTILLSATLPVTLKKSFLQSYILGWKNMSRPDPETETILNDCEWNGYPVITTFGGNGLTGCVVSGMNQGQNISVGKMPYKSEEEYSTLLVDKLKEKLSGGGCAGIVVNTVGRAQKLHDLLEKEFPGYRILLLHSRFTGKGRECHEKEILGAVGKSSETTGRNKTIVIGTQVIEQSLDLDFDVLFSDLAPIDLLLQRSGREHRHPDRPRPDQLRVPEFFIFVPVNENGELQVCKDDVYEAWIQRRTYDLLPETFVIPQNVPDLVNAVYSEGDETYLQRNPAVQHEWHQYLAKIHEKENKTDGIVLQRPMKKERRKTGLVQFNKIDQRANEEQVALSVRDIEESLEVILLKETGADEFTLWDYPEKKLSCRRSLTQEETAIVMGERVRLPKFGPVSKILEAIEVKEDGRFEQWKKDVMLKAQHFLVLDQEGRASLGGMQLQYSKGKGLQKMNSAW